MTDDSPGKKEVQKLFFFQIQVAYSLAIINNSTNDIFTSQIKI